MQLNKLKSVFRRKLIEYILLKIGMKYFNLNLFLKLWHQFEAVDILQSIRREKKMWMLLFCLQSQ